MSWMHYESELIERFLQTDSGDGSWREWIRFVLVRLEDEVEHFSGKRADGDSDWWWRLAAGLTIVDPKIAKTGVVWTEDTLDDFEPDARRVSEAWRAVLDHVLGLAGADVSP
jgi:hypothetical protein